MAQITPKVTDIALVIRSYVEDHPHASDSLEGVQQWWLGTGDVDAPSLAVQQALDLLVKKGAVVKKMLPDGTVLYAGTRPHARAP
jgi:hypothetical protein